MKRLVALKENRFLKNTLFEKILKIEKQLYVKIFLMDCH